MQNTHYDGVVIIPNEVMCQYKQHFGKHMICNFTSKTVDQRLGW